MPDVGALAGKHSDPEVYPRPDGSVYICGEGESVPLPDDPLTIQSNSTARANLMVHSPSAPMPDPGPCKQAALLPVYHADKLYVSCCVPC